ncbi:MAG: hypothetical protein WAT79_11215 [Saprospiraceae bacterium]
MNKNRDFDNSVKKKLGEISTPPLYGSWDTFHQKWNASESGDPNMADPQFDDLIKDKLRNIPGHHVSQHWEKLKYKLETIELFRKKVITNKIKEVLAVFLFLLTFYNVFNHFVLTSTQNHKEYAIESHNLYSLPLLSYADSKEKSKTNQPSVIDKKKIKQPYSIVLKNLSPQDVRPSSNHPVHINSLPIKTVKPTNESVDVTSTPKIPTTPNVARIHTTEVQHEISITAIESKKEAPYSVMATILPMSIIQSTPTQSELRLGAYFAHVNHFILTPFDRVYSLPKFSNSTNNQGYGITIGKKINRLEFESGLEYNHVNYNPALVNETYGANGDVYFETSLQKISFDIVKLPFNLKYFPVNHKNWKMYMMSGAALNVVMQANYEIVENLKTGRPTTQSRFTFEGPRLEEKGFINGILDEGQIKGNYYVDLHFGLGVEKKINKRISCYFQPSYHTFVLSDGIGIGPNNDKLNALHLKTGLKFSFL